MLNWKTAVANRLGASLATLLPESICLAFARRLSGRDPQLLLEALGPLLNREPLLDTMPFDLAPSAPIQFEELAGLFASSSLDHAVIAMTVRQAAYLFGLIRRMHPQKVIEIGRYKGGSTLLIAAAMNGSGQFWSVDLGEKEGRLHGATTHRPFDDQIRDICTRFGLHVTLETGDSRIIDLQTGEVDLVFIDGDHSYDGVRSDFERFGRRVKVGGAVLFDDACSEGRFPTHSDSVGRLISEIADAGEFKVAKTVNRLAHLERVR